MENSTLVKLLRSLKNKELKDFEKYISGRYINHNVPVDLYHHLSKYLFQQGCEELSKEYISKHIIVAADNKRIGSEASKIRGWLEDFLLLKFLEQKEMKKQRQQLLADVYQQRKILNRRNNIIEKLLVDTEKETKEADDYWTLSQLYHQQYVVSHKEYMRANKSSKHLLSAAQENLDFLYIQRSLQFKCELLCRNQIFDEQNEVELPEIANELKVNPTIQAYYLHLLMLQSLNVETYRTAKDYLFNKLGHIHLLDAKRCFSYLINALAKIIRSNQQQYTRETLDLYKKGIAHKILLNHETISSIRFNNILNLAALHSDFDWAYQFIKEYKSYLEKEERIPTVALAKASLLFQQKEFNKVASILHKERFFNTGNEIRKRLLLISCKVELEENSDYVKSIMNAFSSFLSEKKKLSKSVLASSQNYISVLKKLLNREHDKKAIQAQLDQLKDIYMCIWLQEQLNNYKQKYG